MLYDKSSVMKAAGEMAWTQNKLRLGGMNNA